MRRPRRHALLVALLAFAGAAPIAHAAPGSDWTSLASEIATPWPGLQERRGNYTDFTDGEVPRGRDIGTGTRYGDSVLGLALLREGLRHGDTRLLDSGARAIRYTVVGGRRRWLQRYKPSVFESMAVASAYNLMRRRLPARFAHLRAPMRRWLLRVRPVSTILHRPDTRRFSNHYLAEAIEVFELARTGIRSHSRHALVGPDLGRAVRIYRGLMNTGIPALARRKGQTRNGVPTFLISDPPDYPLAYQGLAMGLYAQALRMLGGGSAAARATLRKAANASWLIAAPDGDLGWFGRSMEESWVQSGTALAAEVAADRPGATSRLRLRYRALRDAALTRLRDAYGNGPRGYSFIPALALSDHLGARALEPYAGAPSFAGLTLLQLGWMLDEAPPAGRPVGSLAASRSFSSSLSRGQGRFAVVRRGHVWFAVRQGQSLERRPGDLRYDVGLVAFKSDLSGGWRDVMPQRPLTYARHDSAGPVLLAGGTRGYPWSDRMRVSGGAVTLYGGFRASDGRWLRRGVRFRYAPTACGVRVAIRGRAGDRYEYSAFMRGHRERPSITRAQLSDSGQVVTPVPAAGTVRVEGRGYYSATEPALRRARLRFHLRSAGTVAVTTCARPAAAG